MRCLYRQYQMPRNTTQQKRLLALDIIRHSSTHSKKEDMVRLLPTQDDMFNQAIRRFL